MTQKDQFHHLLVEDLQEYPLTQINDISETLIIILITYMCVFCMVCMCAHYTYTPKHTCKHISPRHSRYKNQILSTQILKTLHIYTHMPLFTTNRCTYTAMTNAHAHTAPTMHTTHSSHPTNLHKYMNRHHMPHTACIHSNTQLHRHTHQMLYTCRFTLLSCTNTHTYHTHLTFPAWLTKLFCPSIVTKIQYK